MGRTAGKFLKYGICLCDTGCYLRKPVERSIGWIAAMESLMRIRTTIIVTTVESKSSEFIRSKTLCLHITAAQNTCQMVIDISHFCFYKKHRVNTRILTWVFCILRFWTDIQIGAASERYGKQASCKNDFI